MARCHRSYFSVGMFSTGGKSPGSSRWPRIVSHSEGLSSPASVSASGLSRYCSDTASLEKNQLFDFARLSAPGHIGVL
jgi:hypothetical protein